MEKVRRSDRTLRKLSIEKGGQGTSSKFTYHTHARPVRCVRVSYITRITREILTEWGTLRDNLGVNQTTGKDKGTTTLSTNPIVVLFTSQKWWSSLFLWSKVSNGAEPPSWYCCLKSYAQLPFPSSGPVLTVSGNKKNMFQITTKYLFLKQRMGTILRSHVLSTKLVKKVEIWIKKSSLKKKIQE